MLQHLKCQPLRCCCFPPIAKQGVGYKQLSTCLQLSEHDMSRAPSIDTAPSGSNRDLSNRASMQFATSGLPASTSRSSHHDEAGQVLPCTFPHTVLCPPPSPTPYLALSLPPHTPSWIPLFLCHHYPQKPSNMTFLFLSEVYHMH